MSRNPHLSVLTLLAVSVGLAPAGCLNDGRNGATWGHVCVATGTFLASQGRGRSGQSLGTLEAAEQAAKSQACTNIANSMLTAPEIDDHLAGLVVQCLETTSFELECEVVRGR